MRGVETRRLQPTMEIRVWVRLTMPGTVVVAGSCCSAADRLGEDQREETLHRDTKGNCDGGNRGRSGGAAGSGHSRTAVPFFLVLSPFFLVLTTSKPTAMHGAALAMAAGDHVKLSDLRLWSGAGPQFDAAMPRTA